MGPLERTPSSECRISHMCALSGDETLKPTLKPSKFLKDMRPHPTWRQTIGRREEPDFVILSQSTYDTITCCELRHTAAVTVAAGRS